MMPSDAREDRLGVKSTPVFCHPTDAQLRSSTITRRMTAGGAAAVRESRARKVRRSDMAIASFTYLEITPQPL